jgi:heme-degrading monooxygenase HmoA
MPYIRITTFRLRAGDRARFEQVADQAVGPLRALPGFRSSRFFASADGTTGGGVSVWETRAQAEAVTAAVRERAQRLLADALVGPPTTDIYEIYEPHRQAHRRPD